MDVLALTIYGIVLFPSIENFVDSAAINVFIANRNQSENPVMTIVADVYGTMHYCHERKGKKILCCLPVLFVWLMTRIFKKSINIKCPVDELLHCKPDVKGENDCAQHFASLNEERIRWRPSWQQRTSLILYCGDYPNVPLIGARCCINYNLILAQRQFDYLIKGSPAPGSLTPFMAYYEDGHVTEMLERIQKAWGKIVYVDKSSRSGDGRGGISYRQWLTERVKQIKLPFSPCATNNELPKDVEIEEVRKLKVELGKMKEKNEEVAKELERVHHDYMDIQRQNVEKTRAYDELFRIQKSERDYTTRIKQDLAAANTELAMRAQERDIALTAERHWKHLYEEVKRDKQEALRRSRAMQVKIGSLEQEMKDVVAACELEINKERWQLMDAEERHQIMVTQMESYIAEQEDMTKHWKECFSQLAALANGAIEDVPRMLSDADGMAQVFDPPKEIKTFINHCKWLVGEMQNLITKSRNS